MKAKFIKAVDSGDVISVRLFLSNELMLDPRGTSFLEMKAYAENKCEALYEAFDGKTYDAVGVSEWNKDFLFTLKNDLDSNFSKERLSLYEKVAMKVLKEKADLLDKEEAKQKSKTQSQTINTKNSTTTTSQKKKIYAGVTIGGAIIAIAGLCIEETAIAYTVTGIGLVGVAVGSVLLYKSAK